MSCGRPCAACQARLGAQIEARYRPRPCPRRANHVPAPGEDDAQNQPDAQEQRRVLVLQADPGRNAHGQPEAPVCAREELQEEPQDDRPEEKVVGGRGVEMARGEIAREGDREGGKELRPPCPPRSRAMSAVEEDGEFHREGGEHPDSRRREPEQGHRRGRQQRRERRLIRIAEGRVAPRDDEVELVAMEAVSAGHGQQRDDHQPGDQEHRPEGGERGSPVVGGAVGGGCHHHGDRDQTSAVGRAPVGSLLSATRTAGAARAGQWSGGGGTTGRSSRRAGYGRQSPCASRLVFAPLGLSAVARRRRALVWVLGGVPLGFVVTSGFTIGLFYLPAAVALAAVGKTDRLVEEAAPTGLKRCVVRKAEPSTGEAQARPKRQLRVSAGIPRDSGAHGRQRLTRNVFALLRPATVDDLDHALAEPGVSRHLARDARVAPGEIPGAVHGLVTSGEQREPGYRVGRPSVAGQARWEAWRTGVSLPCDSLCRPCGGARSGGSFIFYIIRRLFQLVIVLVGVTLVTFTVLKLVPGDAATYLAGNNASPARIEYVRHQRGLDRPYYVQYVKYVERILHGDLGASLYNGRDVGEIIWEAAPVTLQLALAAVLIELLGIPLGVYSAIRQYSVWDSSLTTLALIIWATPAFVLGYLALFIFGFELGWVPIGLVGPRCSA